MEISTGLWARVARVAFYVYVLYLQVCCIAEDSQISRTRDITDMESRPIVCPMTELSLYSGARLAAIVRQLKTQLSREDPGEEFKVSKSFI